MVVDDMISVLLVFILIEMVNVDVFSYENVNFFWDKCKLGHK